MIKTTLKIDGMMCGMCESHMNDVIRKNFKIKKVTSSEMCIRDSDSHGWDIIIYRYTNGEYQELSNDRVTLKDNEKYRLPYICLLYTSGIL